jgi:hypothetical protein
MIDGSFECYWQPLLMTNEKDRQQWCHYHEVKDGWQLIQNKLIRKIKEWMRQMDGCNVDGVVECQVLPSVLCQIK